MLIGLAIGDALGNTSEGLNPASRLRRYGEIRHYLPNWWADMAAVGVPSDDTQLCFWTIESLLRRRGIDPVDVARTFAGDRIFGIGATVTAFLLASRRGVPWFQAGQPSAGNGALMRIAPVVLPHLEVVDSGLWADVITATVITHRDEAAVVSSVGFVGLLMECLAAPMFSDASKEADRTGWKAEPDKVAYSPSWWPRTFLRYARAVETGMVYASRRGPSFSGSLCDFVQTKVLPAVDEGRGTLEVCDGWGSGAYLLETVPCLLHILALHGHDAEEAVVRAVNDTRDNDTIGALVGAAVGALHGEQALPDEWRQGLLGRTREADDGAVQRLVDEVVDTFLS